MSKIKLLILSESLSQGGSEKWIFEICKAIDKEKFEVGVLTSKIRPSADKSLSFKNYYYHRLKDIGIKVYDNLDVHKDFTALTFILYRARRLFRYLLGQTKTVINKEVKEILKRYDVICLIDYYNYLPYKEIIHNHLFFITLHSHKAQFKNDPYIVFDKTQTYNFTYFCPKQIEEIGSSNLDIEKNDFFFSPLVSDLSACENMFNPIDENPIVISIFTRIAHTKNIDSLIKAFAEIERKAPGKAVLNIYGEIIDSDYHLHLLNLISDLQIESDSVHFLGHTQDITNTIKNDHINVYWGLSINASFGYSSIEIGAMGVPCFFWNLDPDTDFVSILDQTDDSIFSHNDINDFVASNLKYILSNESLFELSNKQRSFFINRHHVGGRIREFENYVDSLFATKR